MNFSYGVTGEEALTGDWPIDARGERLWPAPPECHAERWKAPPYDALISLEDVAHLMVGLRPGVFISPRIPGQEHQGFLMPTTLAGFGNSDGDDWGAGRWKQCVELCHDALSTDAEVGRISLRKVKGREGVLLGEALRNNSLRAPLPAQFSPLLADDRPIRRDTRESLNQIIAELLILAADHDGHPIQYTKAASAHRMAMRPIRAGLPGQIDGEKAAELAALANAEALANPLSSEQYARYFNDALATYRSLSQKKK